MIPGFFASAAMSEAAPSETWYSGLFTPGDIGFVIDFSDLSSLYQDVDHLIPVTEAGQTARAAQCRITGAWLTSAEGRVVAYDAVRGRHYLVFTGSGEPFTMSGPSGLGGQSDRSLMMVGAPSSTALNNWFLSIGPAGVGSFIYLANDSAGFALGTFGSGGAARGPAQSGFAVYTGTAPEVGANRGILYRNGDNVAHSETLNATINISSPSVFVGDRSDGSGVFDGGMYGVLAVNRVLSAGEIATSSSFWQ